MKFLSNQRQTLNLRKSLLTCCAAFQVCKQSCPRPLKSLINQETLSPKLLTKLKEQRYSYCVISRYFTLRHLGRLLTPFITKFCFRATAFMQQRTEVTSEFGPGVVGRVVVPWFPIRLNLISGGMNKPFQDKRCENGGGLLLPTILHF